GAGVATGSSTFDLASALNLLKEARVKKCKSVRSKIPRSAYSKRPSHRAGFVEDLPFDRSGGILSREPSGAGQKQEEQ
ncbi:MAG: hypothetical protein LAO07_19110, partial [Acidobacteriia bacterium]|nr:hypothetical protein [Terriglobia bacterium]